MEPRSTGAAIEHVQLQRMKPRCAPPRRRAHCAAVCQPLPRRPATRSDVDRPRRRHRRYNSPVTERASPPVLTSAILAHGVARADLDDERAAPDAPRSPDRFGRRRTPRRRWSMTERNARGIEACKFDDAAPAVRRRRPRVDATARLPQTHRAFLRAARLAISRAVDVPPRRSRQGCSPPALSGCGDVEHAVRETGQGASSTDPCRRITTTVGGRAAKKRRADPDTGRDRGTGPTPCASAEFSCRSTSGTDRTRGQRARSTRGCSPRGHPCP